jgi:hypothetical protein
MKFSGISQKSDWVGILSSAGCILHCLAMPVVVYASGAALHGKHTEWLDYLFVAVAAIAVVYSVRQAHTRAVKFLLIGAWLVFSVGIVLQPAFAPASLLAYAGSVGLIAGHAINLRHCRQCKVHKRHVTA